MDAHSHTAFGFRRTIRPNRRFLARGGLGPVIAPMMLATLALSGCSSVLGDGSKPDLACPKVGIVRDANKITLFRPGNGRAPTDVMTRGLIADYAGTCTYDASGVAVDVSLVLVAERGPAMVGNQAPFTYFVAVSTPDGTVVNKQEFPTTVDFPANGPRAGSREDLQPRIPLPKGQDARTYQILVGFQLSPDQLDYNRRADVH